MDIDGSLSCHRSLPLGSFTRMNSFLTNLYKAAEKIFIEKIKEAKRRFSKSLFLSYPGYDPAEKIESGPGIYRIINRSCKQNTKGI